MLLLLGFTRFTWGGVVVVVVDDPETSITTAEPDTADPDTSVAVGVTFLAFLTAGAAVADAWINRGAS